MLYNKLTTKERLTKIKIQLQDEQPFWAYLILKLQMQEDTKGYLPPYAGMGVNAWGKMYWKKEFVDNLNDNELKFVLAHEVGHLVFAHLIRKGVREVIPFNVAADIVLNDVLCHNNFIPPKDFLLPKNHEITLGKVVIKDTDKKTAEEVYDEIPRENFPNGQGYNFDDHSYDDNMSESEKAKVKEKKKTDPLRMHEPLMLSLGTATTLGIVQQAGKKVKVTLRRSICASKGDKVAISRQFQNRWRLIGFGIIL